ncbi:glycerophosphodiester phosphodiesterase [Paraburkholderia sp. Tr-20389]|uniref:glycerophosphodiester phosphodiesterase family protein n=1 Tax=Paraburkholderia sp. Tr-20389 TaxID=2703903 RepID=UPI0019803E63|nr:glycerophosphodiester phosphodiesterase family protein [Paraburkholderia sp. Tr-20389]MBN3757712.1 glycerophosphodiester phosphodiesterase [Paraburkholderia sp. Tr-20389]
MRTSVLVVAVSLLAGLPACTTSPAVAPTHASSGATLPALIAHRGGTADYPENTLPAIEGALAHRADVIWLTVQLSRDGVPVLYRPKDLSALTDASGPVADRTAAELARVNAGWQFEAPQAPGVKPYRAKPVGIPTLEDALRLIPRNLPVVLDMKALPAAPQADAVARVLDALNAWPRVTIYSTEADYQSAFARYPQARVFESRDATRQRLFGVALTGQCDAPRAGTRAGFELGRKVELIERFTLGEGRSTFTARTWTPASVQCFRRAADTWLIAFAVNDEATYREAACLRMDAVLVDSPETMSRVRAKLQSTSLDCTPQTGDDMR